jgi:hypothetical protein
MVTAGIDQATEVTGREFKDAPIQFLGKVGGAVTVLWIVTIAETARIIEEGKQFD